MNTILRNYSTPIFVGLLKSYFGPKISPSGPDTANHDFLSNGMLEILWRIDSILNWFMNLVNLISDPSPYLIIHLINDRPIEGLLMG